MKAHYLLLLSFCTASWAAGETVLKPEARERIRKNMAVLTQNIDRARGNLLAATHNVDTLTAEVGELERLQKEHEALKAKYEGMEIEGAADKERHKALLKGIQDSLSAIETQRSPLQKQLAQWKDRQKNYELKVAEFEKKREELEAPPQLVTPDTDAQ